MQLLCSNVYTCIHGYSSVTGQLSCSLLEKMVPKVFFACPIYGTLYDSKEPLWVRHIEEPFFIQAIESLKVQQGFVNCPQLFLKV